MVSVWVAKWYLKPNKTKITFIFLLTCPLWSFPADPVHKWHHVVAQDKNLSIILIPSVPLLLHQPFSKGLPTQPQSLSGIILLFSIFSTICSKIPTSLAWRSITVAVFIFYSCLLTIHSSYSSQNIILKI